MSEYEYFIFKEGLFSGKYTRLEWLQLRPHQIFECHVYCKRNTSWYISQWGSLIPLMTVTFPKRYN